MCSSRIRRISGRHIMVSSSSRIRMISVRSSSMVSRSMSSRRSRISSRNLAS